MPHLGLKMPPLGEAKGGHCPLLGAKSVKYHGRMARNFLDARKFLASHILIWLPDSVSKLEKVEVKMLNVTRCSNSLIDQEICNYIGNHDNFMTPENQNN